MKKVIIGLLIGLSVALFTWWLQNAEPELRWIATQTQFDPVAPSESEYAGMTMYTVKLTNKGRATAKNVNIEISLSSGSFVSADIDVPERFAIEKWTEVTKAKRARSLGLQYRRLLPDDKIQLGALFKGGEDELPEIAVRSERVSGVSQEEVDAWYKTAKAAIQIGLIGIICLLCVVAVLSLKYDRWTEYAMIPIMPVIGIFAPQRKESFDELRARRRFEDLMDEGKYDEALETLAEVDGPIAHYGAAACYSQKEDYQNLAWALDNWMKEVYEYYIERSEEFEYLRSLPLGDKVRDRLTKGLESDDKSAGQLGDSDRESVDETDE